MNDRPPPGSPLQQVLPGNSDDLDQLAGALENYVDGAVAATRRMRAMDSGGWIGEAADAFWGSVGDVLKKLDGAATAFQEAALAFRTYSGTLRTAQADVSKALVLIDQADAETRSWSAKNTDAVIENVTSPYTGIITPLSDADPGERLRQQADTLISEARERVQMAARHAAECLKVAADHAPDKPGFWERRWHNVTEIAGGAVESTLGMGEFVFKLSPAYELINPEGYAENAVGLIKGLAYGATHPVDFAKAALDWDTWARSPGRAIGHLLPTVALALASAGAGAAGKAGEAGEAAEAVETAEVAKAAERAGKAVGATEHVAGLSAAESSILNQGRSIFASPEFGTLREAHAAGSAAEVNIAGTTVVYEPSLPASGMTLFGEHGFLLGPEAFVNESELSQTVLHELFRLGTSASAEGVSGDLATVETNAAAEFAARNHHLLPEGR